MGGKSIDFNFNQCVRKIAPIKQAPTKNTGGNSIGQQVQCAMKCSMISDGVQLSLCMQQCLKSSNVAIYKSAIGTSQYNWW
jgi:hypothetical protein